jgi:tetratricopeptide (TPR) repeat protein
MTRARFLTHLLPVLALSALAAALAGCRSAHTTSAILYIEEQQYQKAVDVLHEGFIYRDDEPDAYYWLGEAYSKLADEAVYDNDYKQAKKYYGLAYTNYRKAEELAPKEFTERANIAMLDNYTRRSNEAKRDFEAGYYEQAEGHFRLAYAALPDSIAPIKNIAGMKMQQAASEGATEARQRELFEEALALLNQVLAEKPDAYLLQSDKASLLTQLGRPQEAQRIYDDLLRQHSDDPQLLKDIAFLSLRQGDFARAAELYIQVADIYADDTDPANDAEIDDLLRDAGGWFGLPVVGRYEEALDALNRAAEMEPVPTLDLMQTRLQTFYQYGQSLKDQAEEATDPSRKSELEARAREQFQRGVDIGNALTNLYPTAATGYQFLGLCQIEVGELDAAQLNLKTYDELSAGNATP